MCLAALAPAVLCAQARPQQNECRATAPGTCILHVAQDEAGILTSPLRMQAKDLVWIVPFGLATGAAVDYDAHAMRTLGVHPQQENDFRHYSDAVGLYLPVGGVVVGYAAGVVRHDDYLSQTAVLGGEAMVDAVILNEGLKYAFNRQSPQQGDGTGRFWPHGTKTWPDGQSMPSNHAALAWSFAHVVAARYPGWGTRLVAYGLATTVTASRVMAREHFPSDVVVGSTLGYLIGGYVTNVRGEASRNYSFSMVNTPNGRGVQLTYNFGN